MGKIGLWKFRNENPSFQFWNHRPIRISIQGPNSAIVHLQVPLKVRQDGRLAPAYSSPDNKNFDQRMQTVKNDTTV